MWKKTTHLLSRNLLSTAAVLALMWAAVFAAAPIWWYAPWETLNPDCAPWSSDCIIAQAWDTTNDSWTMSGANVFVNSWNVGIWINGPDSKLEVAWKIRSASTEETDPWTTVITKDYYERLLSEWPISRWALPMWASMTTSTPYYSERLALTKWIYQFQLYSCNGQLWITAGGGINISPYANTGSIQTMWTWHNFNTWNAWGCGIYHTGTIKVSSDTASVWIRYTSYAGTQFTVSNPNSEIFSVLKIQ